MCLFRSGAFVVTGDQLAPPRRARSVRVRDGRAIVTDGPFIESKEAIEIAAGQPVAQTGTIEVRPLWGSH